MLKILTALLAGIAVNIFAFSAVTASAEAAFEIGASIEFGGYSWRVLDVQDGRALIITEHVIAQTRYHNRLEGTTWEDSAVRGYLNGALYYMFTAEERARIAKTRLENRDNPWFGTDGGQDTYDRIFLLSLNEVIRYFGDSGMFANRPSGFWGVIDEFSGSRAAKDRNGEASRWWLRSSGANSYYAASVDTNGHVHVYGNIASGTGDAQEAGLRPALWLYTEDIPKTPPQLAPGGLTEFGGYIWRVLDVLDDRALIITEHVLFNMPFYERAPHDSLRILWENSTVRRYLNSDFYYGFTSEERARIAETLITTAANPWFGTYGGANTTDKIFLLCADEVVRYFGDSGRMARGDMGEWWFGDRYSDNRRAFYADGGIASWWTRSPGYGYGLIINIHLCGCINPLGFYSRFHMEGGIGVRPALWLMFEH